MSVSVAWQDLAEHYQALQDTHLQDLFRKNPNRFSQFSLQSGEILLDYSKQKLTHDTLDKLCRLAEESNLSEYIKQLFSGGIVNHSEQRPALHIALRDPTSSPLIVNGINIKPEVQAALARMMQFVDSVRSKKHLGKTGKPITDIISLGIGGSDLGPAMVCAALDRYKSTDLNLHFVSNVDGWTLASLLKKLNPETTLCIVNSKTFTTPETLQNAKTIKSWLYEALGAQSDKKHLIGVTANKNQAETFGISPENIFEFWDYVGGRYSVWSAVGLPIALLLGNEQFQAFLDGAHAMDQHFYIAPFSANMPILMGLLGIWNINYFECKTQAIIPYDDGLQLFPDYLQQLEMESNGKRAERETGFVDFATAPVIWGGVGCNGQHAYMQLLHQGTQVIPVDFIVGALGHQDFEDHQKLLLASCFSQSKALMEGNHDQDLKMDPLKDAKLCIGNRPSSTLIYPTLTPRVLGSLIALYEHKVFVQGVLWGINSFDQWGVELGKNLVKKILPDLEKPLDKMDTDSSTKGLIGFYQKCTEKL